MNKIKNQFFLFTPNLITKREYVEHLRRWIKNESKRSMGRKIQFSLEANEFLLLKTPMIEAFFILKPKFHLMDVCRVKNIETE